MPVPHMPRMALAATMTTAIAAAQVDSPERALTSTQVGEAPRMQHPLGYATGEFALRTPFTPDLVLSSSQSSQEID